MTFSIVTILIGVAYGLPQVYGLMNPDAFKQRLKAFPRDVTMGYVLMLISTCWFLYNVYQEDISDFEAYKNLMLGGFAAVGIGSCIYLRDFLGARGLAVFLLLLAKLVVDTGRWVETPLRLIVITWAYVWILAGMWWTISPWRCRDWLAWNMADEARFKLLTMIRAAFSILVIILGATVFRG